MRTRFAPSPNGLLHLGHAYAAIQAHDAARRAGGQFLLRIEDIDGSRSRPEFVEKIFEDLDWLGLSWDEPPVFQSRRVQSYAEAFDSLVTRQLVYPCTCTRRSIAEALKHKSVPHGPDGPVYPGTCRNGSAALHNQVQWRLKMDEAIQSVGPQSWHDERHGIQQADPALFGDIVLWRKDAPASYHLAATLDDAASGITHVVRGTDLFAYSSLHRLLQGLLGLPEPDYHHHGLLVDERGEKLAKSRNSPALAQRRTNGEDGRKLAADLRAGRFPTGITLKNA